MCQTGTETLRQRPVAGKSKDTLVSGTTDRNQENRPTTTDPTKKEGKRKLNNPVWSSTLPFYPPSDKYWRIGNTWYDLSSFNHPGGKQVLELSRDRFEDATFAFEAHHHDYQRARKILQKYRVPDEVIAKEKDHFVDRPTREESSQARFAGPRPTHHDRLLDANNYPNLADDDAFYSVLRRRVAAYLRDVGCKDGGPTWACIVFFWSTFFTWLSGMCLTYHTGSYWWAAFTGFFGAWLCSFGHNWTHQPKYKNWGWGILSLDMCGYSSEGWFRDHVLQHHMFTNTPWDHHLHCMDPFLLTDPCTPRNFVQRNISPYLFHAFFSWGSYFNYFFHTVWLLQGWEEWSIGKPIFLIEHYLFWQKWGFHGLCLVLATNAVVANYFFTLSWMNHNAEETKDVKARNESKDWGEAQLRSCADWSVHLNFFQSMIYLNLNYHTLHHMFPKVDFCHYPNIQRIMEDTCQDFGIEYAHYKNPLKLYWNMILTFGENPSSVKEILVYGGGAI
ncbi:Acyl-lipid (8-3)-desaturase [Seminavis robusta]|uniref:Acyl-lipid (8-3)-desaturase n=1 Tax=Seminavis robusta TaxID=568900 RepID=A0A9N8EFR2_9STRA|nr:Acyl-lipid (8-3)-desaturase [Seminavis robusta]|eukprot:Sro1121_g243410.1 Acyl-lipid (8-3)-desaturase (502) ;mRNA; f:20681-22296